MRKIFDIEVDCAACAEILEETARKQQGIDNARVNFMAQRMTVDFEESSNSALVMKQVIKACKRAVPDSEIYI